MADPSDGEEIVEDTTGLIVETREGRFEVGPLLRRGATGVVHRGRWKESPTRPWVDAVLKLESTSAQKRQMAREVDVYRLLDAAPVPPPRGASFARHVGNLTETIDIGTGPCRCSACRLWVPILMRSSKKEAPVEASDASCM